MKRAFALTAVAAAALFALAARADRSLTILITVDRDVPELVGRLRAELEQLGFVVKFAPSDARSLGEQGRDAGVDAAVRVTPNRRGVEVWAFNTASRESAVREVVLPTQAEAHEGGVVALRAAELVRAAFLEVHVELPERDAPVASASASASAEAPPAASSAAPVASSAAPGADTRSAAPVRAPPAGRGAPAGEGTFGTLTLGYAELVAEGVGSLSPQAWLAARLRTGRHLSVEGLVATSLASGTWTGAEGRVVSSATLAGLGASYETDSRPFVARAGVGAGALWLRLHGEATPPFRGHDASAWSALPYAHLGAEWWPARRLALALDLLGATPIPDPEVHVGTRSAGGWGSPLVLAGVGVVGALE